MVRVGGELLTPFCCGQGLVVSYCYHLAVVKGWRSAIDIILLWSGVGGQLLTSCCGQGLVVSYCYHLAVVKGWWPAIDIILLWSGVGGQLLLSSCCGPGFVVSY